MTWTTTYSGLPMRSQPGYWRKTKVKNTYTWKRNFRGHFGTEDMVYGLSIRQNIKRETIVDLSGHPDFIPVVKGINRMRDIQGHLLLQPVNDYTKVTYAMHIELSGKIPPWLANKHIHMLPLKTLGNLIRIAEKK